MLEGLLHLVVGAFFLLVVGGAAARRVRRESIAGEAAAERGDDGWMLSLPTRIMMLTAFGGFGTAMVSAVALRAWGLSIPPESWARLVMRSTGGALVVLGAVIVVAVFIGTRKRTWAVDTDVLSTDGIYGRTRNPRALGWFLVYFGAALAAGSGAGLALAPVYLLGYLPWILLEEVALERHFGDEYREYRRRTPRFI